MGFGAASCAAFVKDSSSQTSQVSQVLRVGSLWPLRGTHPDSRFNVLGIRHKFPSSPVEIK